MFNSFIELILYLGFIGAIWGSFRKGFYDGILYGLIHKKAGTAIGSVRFRPYLYAGQAICRGWGLIGSPGVVFLIIAYMIHLSHQDTKDYFHSIGHYYIIYIIGYSIILGYLYFGYRWIKEGYIDGIKNKKTKTYYHLQNGEKYYLHSAKEKERTISKHKYFRGQKAVKTGIVRVGLGSAYVLVALLLFLDRDYYMGDATKSMYPNAFEIAKEYYQTHYPKQEKKEQSKQEVKKDTTQIKEEAIETLRLKDSNEKFYKSFEEFMLNKEEENLR
ncbi:hypothetical protein [Arcobacter sp. FWKO B]|uniref:hypothetical protein n=1 Tax=Arcobacter sp. FWKO B TaxID=2593672 RepID=UPI001902D512|nr:hypothetical protein [Arcobacter sp. FWKO B]